MTSNPGDLDSLTEEDDQTLTMIFTSVRACLDLGIIGDTEQERQAATNLMDRFAQSAGVALIIPD
jgi:hypothetical protein